MFVGNPCAFLSWDNGSTKWLKGKRRGFGLGIPFAALQAGARALARRQDGKYAQEAIPFVGPVPRRRDGGNDF